MCGRAGRADQFCAFLGGAALRVSELCATQETPNLLKISVESDCLDKNRNIHYCILFNGIPSRSEPGGSGAGAV
jgi:hypothetical protein